MFKRLLVTGGAGFIGSSFIRYGLSHIVGCERIVNLDLLTYAANLQNLQAVQTDGRYRLIKGDIADEKLVETICAEERIDAIVHFAAETHVDRSIVNPRAFYHTNVEGTIALLEVVRRYPSVHFHHISTDEVYGSLDSGQFTENSNYQPNSPYAASKAASDHFVRAYANTYSLSTTISHCTNNYGPGQHFEKLIPMVVSNCIKKTQISVYGSGEQVRDWIYVEDHSRAIWDILLKGQKNEVYGIGGQCEKRNIDVINTILQVFAELNNVNVQEYLSLVAFVPDRLGHDFRYAMNCTKIKNTTGWSPAFDFYSGIKETVSWYLKSECLGAL